MQFFNDLGSLIERRWREQNYSEEVFPDLAAEALAEHSPYGQVDPWEAIRWVFNTTSIPSQQDLAGEFGDPPITLYTGPRFYIDLYFWLDGTTTIHQHAFCGAFQVLMGSSIHSQYSFRDRQQINQHFAVGRAALESVTLLEEGAIKQIQPGEQYIHSLFHLDRPSATICARTYHTIAGSPQYSYYPPGIAADPFFKEPLAIKQQQSAALLLKMQHPEADALIGDLIARSDLQTAFAFIDLARSHLSGNQLEQAFGVTTGEERFQKLMEIARHRHGDLIDFIIPVFEESQRQNNLIYRRSQITGSEHRFFLALLLNVPDRVRVLDLVRQRFPDRNPVETILDWIDELAATKTIGSPEPNVMGIADFDDDYLFVFQCLLEGKTLEQTKAAYEDEFSIEAADSSSDKLERLYDAIRHSMPFKGIFLDSTARSTTAVAV